MVAANLRKLGFGQIVTLEALLRLRNVTHAAEETNQSRPAVSASLRRLREILADELLVPKGRDLTLTELGASILAPTQAILLQADAIYSPSNFDCRTSTRNFNLLADEQSLELCLPHLAWAFEKEAPHAHLSVGLLRSDSADRFERGEIDLLLSPDYVLSTQHPSCNLYNSGWVIVASADNDLYGTAPTVEQLRSARHVVRETRGNKFGYASLDVALRTPTYAMMVSVIAGSSMLGIVPTRIGERFVTEHRLKLLTHPEPPEEMRHLMQWHRHRVTDAGVNWFRRLCADLGVFRKK